MRRISYARLLEWEAYDALEPLPGYRGDWQTATICACLMNAIWRPKTAFEPKDFLLTFGETLEQPEKAQSAKNRQMKFIAQQVVAFTNADQKKKRR